MKKPNNTSNVAFFCVFLLAAAVIILLPFALRAMKDNPTLPGDEPYYHARIASQIMEEGFPKQDSLVLNGRPYVFNPYHFVLAGFSYIFGVISASRLLPLLSGLLSVALLYLLLQRFRFNRFTIFSVIGIFILSPVFTYAFSLSTPACLVILFNLLGLYFFMGDKKWHAALSALFFCTSAFFGVLHAIVPAAIVAFYAYYNKSKSRRAYFVIALLCLVLFAFDVPVYLQQEHFDFAQKSHIMEFVSDLGGIGGFSVFMILLALLGIIGAWKYKKDYYLLYAAVMLIVVYSFFDLSAIVYSNFILVFFAGIAFSGLARMKWRLVQVRNFSLVVLFCGLLFSTISHAVAISVMQPDGDMQDALLWLASRSSPNSIIFSHYSKGFWIEFWAERPVLIDSLSAESSDAGSLYAGSGAIFNSNDLSITRKLLSKQVINYIFLTKDMPEGLVWEKQGQGLDFLLTNNETFKKRYANPCCEIYEYIYQENFEK